MQSASLKGRSILVVEDEPLIALDITLAFVPTGASVTTTNTLAHALILAEHDGLSGAILDHSLPDGDCCKLCARLKQASPSMLPGISMSVRTMLIPSCASCRMASSASFASLV